MSQQPTPQEEQKVKPADSSNWADATPAGLVALAVACFCYFAMLTGLVDAGLSVALLGCWLTGGFVVQFVVGIIDLKNKNATGGCTFAFFSGFFMLTGALSMFIKAGVFGGGAEGPLATAPPIDGFAWMALGLALLLWTPAFIQAAGQLFLIVIGLDVAIPFLVLKDLGIFPGADQAFGIIAGVCLLICGLLGLWLAAVLIVNKAFGREVYPTLKPFYRPKKDKDK